MENKRQFITCKKGFEIRNDISYLIRNKANIIDIEELKIKKWVAGDDILKLPSTVDRNGITGNGEPVILVQFTRKDYELLKGELRK